MSEQHSFQFDQTIENHRSQVINLRYSGDKRIPRGVAKDPKEEQQAKPAPKIHWRERERPFNLAADSALRKPQKKEDEERQRQDHQRIKFECRDRVQMQ